jgi:hypothetical protein
VNAVKTAAVCLFLAGVLFAGAGLQTAQAEPSRLYLTPEILGLGGRAELPSDGSDYSSLRIAGVDLKWRRLRVGTSFIEAGYGVGSISLLPVRLGYTLWERPRRYLRAFYGMTPEFYLQTTVTVWPRNGEAPPYDRFVGHAEVRAAADIFGIGLDVGAGLVARYGNTFTSASYRWAVRPAIDARLKLGVASFGL